MKKICFLFLILATSTFAQRTIPNPIILIHGWTGSPNETWTDFANYLQNQAGLSIDRTSLKSNLNCDYNLNTSYLYNDVCDESSAIGNNDVYIVNFNVANNQSNQSAIVKQGYALKMAIMNVLVATGANKVVLLGHSMGGLAAREYLQNSSNWVSTEHKIAKLITIGTPHGGSDLTSANILGSIGATGDEYSEAARDFRTSYAFSGQRGVYLFGGNETNSWMQNAIFGSSYKNLDVNCNGRIGDTVVGLNQKNMPSDLDFACIIGGPNSSDGAVTVYSQNLNNFYEGLSLHLYYYQCNSLPFKCHSDEPKKAFKEMMQSLDEPKFAISTNNGLIFNSARIYFDNNYSGFLNRPSSVPNIDSDSYKFTVHKKGIIKYSAQINGSSDAKVIIQDYQGTVIERNSINNSFSKSIELSPGEYHITIEGSVNNSDFDKYNFSLTFSNLPVCETPKNVVMATSNPMGICEGTQATIIVQEIYDSYKWKKNGITIATTKENYLLISDAGKYSVEISKCGNNVNSNEITLISLANPKPTITVEIKPNSYILTSNTTNNSWDKDGINITGKISPMKEIEVQSSGIYLVRTAYDNSCTGKNSVEIKVEQPSIKTEKATICEGESTTIETSNLFNRYRWKVGKDTVFTNTGKLVVSTSKTVSVVGFRGQDISPESTPISIKANPYPAIPTINIVANGLQSSSPINNQWYANGIALKDSVGQYLQGFGGGGYTVRVTENGCSTSSSVFTITATEPTTNSFKLYPNPNAGTFWIELLQNNAKWDIAIFDIQGHQIFNKREANSSIEEISLRGSQGTYFLKLTSKEGVKTAKVIIE